MKWTLSPECCKLCYKLPYVMNIVLKLRLIIKAAVEIFGELIY